MESGFIIINKSSGPTSHDIINQLRRITGIKKIGHAGTLDPFASGVLICAIGREATREIDAFVKLDKEYIAEIFLGAETDTYDRTGKIKNSELKTVSLELEAIKNVINNFIGLQMQIPPMYSAKKINGQTLYKLARKGVEIKRMPNEINIYDIEILNYSYPIFKLKINCSSGTYIRSLAHDIGHVLGVGAYLKELTRTKIGKYDIGRAVRIDQVSKENWPSFLFK